MDISKYKCLIQKDVIGDIIDVYPSDFDTSGSEKNCIVCSIDEAKEYKKTHPSKEFFTYGLPDDVIEYINFLLLVIIK